MRTEPARKAFFKDEEDFKQKFEVVDNHNEDLEEEDQDFTDFYSLWEEDRELDD